MPALNIVYGVSGEGLGHVFEALQVIARLHAEGHRVKVLTYGDRACEALSSLNPTRIEGISLQFDDKGMSLGATVSKNLKCIPFFVRNWRRLRRELEVFRPDVFITAYEPFTMIAAHVLDVPLVSMDNQNELLYVQAPPDTDMFAFHLTRLATRLCTFGAAHYVVKTYNKPATARKGVHFVAPVIQAAIRNLTPTDGDHVLVYLTKENPSLIRILRQTEEKFIVYCHNRVGQEGNIVFRAKGPSFVGDLAACKAIIGTTGFSLVADSIFLKKPYFGVPLRKQFEQTYNARYLTAAGFGSYSEEPTREQLVHFLENLGVYRENLRRHDLDPAEQEATLMRILEKIGAARARRRSVL